jgi:hypothetical protein
MIIKNKKDIEHFLSHFEEFAEYDGSKYYFSFTDGLPQGTITLMKYPGDRFTLHQKNKYFWDIKEQIQNPAQLSRTLWYYRRHVNTLIKTLI